MTILCHIFGWLVFSYFSVVVYDLSVAFRKTVGEYLKISAYHGARKGTTVSTENSRPCGSVRQQGYVKFIVAFQQMYTKYLYIFVDVYWEKTTYKQYLELTTFNIHCTKFHAPLLCYRSYHSIITLSNGGASISIN